MPGQAPKCTTVKADTAVVGVDYSNCTSGSNAYTGMRCAPGCRPGYYVVSVATEGLLLHCDATGNFDGSQIGGLVCEPWQCDGRTVGDSDDDYIDLHHHSDGEVDRHGAEDSPKKSIKRHAMAKCKTCVPEAERTMHDQCLECDPAVRGHSPGRTKSNICTHRTHCTCS